MLLLYNIFEIDIAHEGQDLGPDRHSYKEQTKKEA